MFNRFAGQTAFIYFTQAGRALFASDAKVFEIYQFIAVLRLDCHFRFPVQSG